MTRYMVLVSWESSDTFGRDGGNVQPLKHAVTDKPIAWVARAQAEEAVLRVRELVEWVEDHQWRGTRAKPRPDFCPETVTPFDFDFEVIGNDRYFYVSVDDEQVLVCSDWTGYFDSFWDARVVEEQSGEGEWKL